MDCLSLVMSPQFSLEPHTCVYTWDCTFFASDSVRRGASLVFVGASRYVIVRPYAWCECCLIMLVGYSLSFVASRGQPVT